MKVSDQMNQPGQIHRSFFGWGFFICKGFLALLDVIGWIRARLNRERRRFQRMINIMPLGVVILVSKPANFIRPGARPHEDERGQVQVWGAGSERSCPLLIIRMRFEDLHHLDFEGR
jgi:hypothetical protein